MCSDNSDTSKHYADVYRELMAEMRWRRDQDAKYLTVFFAVCAFSIAALVTMLRAGTTFTHIHFIAASVTAFLIIIVGVACVFKIYADHKEYERLGPEVISVLDRWKMVAPDARTEAEYVFPYKYRELGSGGGWGRTSAIILVVVIAVLIGWLCLACGCHREKRANQSPEPTAMSVTPPAAQEPRQP